MPKAYAFLGLGLIYFFLVFFNIAGEFLVNFIGFAIPGYYSLNALFTTGSTDDTQVSIMPTKLTTALKVGSRFPEQVKLTLSSQWLTVCALAAI